MTLPTLLVLTDRSQCSRPLVDVVAAVVGAGARAVVLREKDLPQTQRARLAERLQRILDPVGGLLVVAGARGRAVHLSARDVFPHPRPSLVGRSCHGAEEVASADAEGCDYVTVSPVFATPSKPGYGPALGAAGLALLTAASAPPTYALGGVHPPDVASCLAAGAAGVAVMGPLMRDPELVPAYLAALRRGAG